MPHLFVNRLRRHALHNRRIDDLRHQFQWEILNAMSYLTGGLIFISGSVLFLPKYEANISLGSWLFIIGSIFYLLVSGHDLFEVLHSSQPHWVDGFAATSYLVGGIIFIAGSYLFLPSVGGTVAGAYSFIVGSILFIVGAVFNSIQIFDSPTRESALFANLTAVCYVMGSTLFLSGSVPYLWTLESDQDAHRIYEYLGTQFVIGSVLFVIGGIINLWRAYLIFLHGLKTSPEDFQSKASEIVSGFHHSSVTSLPPSN